ncbi:Protein trichome birefringence-like 8 [Linum grandiflorum]
MENNPQRKLPAPFLFRPVIIRREIVYTFLSFLLLILSSLYALDLLDPASFFRVGFLLPSSQPPIRVCDRGYDEGEWVRSDEGSYYTEDCPFLDPGFRCRWNGRADVEFRNWRWQPKGCDLPRFNATDFLERARNGRVVFAGDSIGRNQWESFLCMLAQGVSNVSTIYEVNGAPISKHRGFLSMRFSEYNLTVEYYRVPFLVIIGRPPRNSPADVKTAIKVDQLHWFSRRNGTWNDGGHCDADLQPETDPKHLEPESVNNRPISDVVTQMRWRNKNVQYLNITHLTEYRSDGHPSRHREPGTPPDAPQDCSHWCLPGIPDVWNEVMYAQLLSMGFKTK